MSVVILPHCKVMSHEEKFELSEPEDIWTKRFRTDAAVQTISLGGPTPRCRIRGYPEGLMFTFLIFDLDCPEHSSWKSKSEAEVALDSVLESLPSGWGGYTTRAGIRLCSYLSEDVPVEKANSLITQVFGYLKVRIGDRKDLTLDESCSQWNHLFRCAKVRRDGVDLESYVVVPSKRRPFDAGTFILATEGRLESHELVDYGKFKDLPPLTDAEWKALPYNYPEKYNLMEGEPLFGTGKRNNGIIKIILPKCIHSHGSTKVDPEILFRSLKPTIEAQDNNPTLDQVWSLVHEWGNFHNSKIQKNHDFLEKALKARESCEGPESAGTTPFIVFAPGAAHPLILMRDGQYKMVNKEIAPIELKREHGVPVEDSKGRIKPWTTIYDSLNGVTVRGVRRTYAGTKPYVVDETLVEPIVQKFTEGKFSTIVDAWLREMVIPPDYGRFIDWLWAVPRVHKPSAALLIIGSPGCGKTRLADGISNIWGTLPVVAGAVLDSAFNDEAGATPIYVADEGLHFTRASGVENFKRIITDTTTRLRGMYSKPIMVMGSCRFIITGNDLGALKIPSNTSPQSVAAIEERVLYARCKGGKGEENREKWEKWFMENGIPEVDDIARHVLWISENHKLSKPPGRFLVYGKIGGEWSRARLADATGLPGQIAGLVALLVNAGNPTTAVGFSPSKHKDMVFLQVPDVISLWKSYEENLKCPTRNVIKGALKAMTPGGETVREQVVGGKSRVRYWTIPFKNIIKAAEDNGVPSEVVAYRLQQRDLTSIMPD